jgi:hypothetical protein
MAIIRSDPENFDLANVVQVDSDAPENIQAIHEIDEWASQHGFARVNDYWLRRIITSSGKRVFRGVCYRITEEEKKSIDAAIREDEATMSSLPVTPHRKVGT